MRGKQVRRSWSANKWVMCMLGFFTLFLAYSSPAFAGVQEGEGEYEIYPAPQSVNYVEGTTTMTDFVNVTCGEDIDEYTKARVEDALEALDLLQAWSSNEYSDDNVKMLVGVYGSGDAADQYGKAHNVDASLYTSDDRHDAYTLWIADGEIVILGKDTDAAFYGATTLKHIFGQMEGKAVRNLTIQDYAEIKYRGALEGYYGNPWSVEDRIDMMEFGGEIKMNQYGFAPKDDPYHNSKWRLLYPEAELKDMEAMALAGNKSKCYFVYMLHPFMNNPFRFDTEAHYQEDLQIIKSKFTQLMEAGIRRFGILADDSGGASGQNLQKMMNDLVAWLHEMKDGKYSNLDTNLVFCPQDYMNTETEMLKSFCNGLSEEVLVAMTGGAIWGKVTNKFMNDFYNGQGRYPYMWVNWPCNDNTKTSTIMGGHNYILEKGLDGRHCKGMILNAMQESEPSKVGIFTGMDYAWNIWQTEAEGDQAWEDSFKYLDHMTALETEESSALREAARHMITQSPDQTNGKQVQFDESLNIKDQLESFKTKMQTQTLTAAEVDEMKKAFETIHNAASHYIENGKNERMVSQITPFLSCLRDMADADIRLMDIMSAIINNNSNGIWENFADAKAAYEQSKLHGFNYYGLGTVYAKAGRKYLEPFTDEVLKYLSEKVILAVNPETGGNVEPYVISSVAFKPNASMGEYGSNTKDKLIDGNDSTFLWVSKISAVGDYIQFDLGEEKTVGRVRALVGADGTDKWTRYRLAYSADGNLWTNLDSYSGAASGKDTYVEDLGGVSARYLRLICEKANAGWSKFSEFTVYPGRKQAKAFDATVTHIDRWSMYQGSLANLTDGKDTTIAYFDSGDDDASHVGDWIQLDLGEVKTIGTVRAVVGASGQDKWVKYHLAYSETAEEGSWTDLDSFQGADTGKDIYQASLGGAKARYVRLINDEFRQKWVQFSEFSVYPYREEAEEKYVGSISTTDRWDVYTGPESNLIDGNDQTYVEYKEQKDADRDVTKAGDYIQMDLGSVKLIGRVRILVGAEAGSANNKWEEYHLEYSKDGQTWESLSKFAGATSGLDIYTVNLNGASARYVRLVNDKDRQVWVKFSEFSVYSFIQSEEERYSAEVSESDVFTIYGGHSRENLTDGSDTSYVYYSTRQQNQDGKKDTTLAGDYIQLDLGSVKPVGRIRAVVGAEDGTAKDKWDEYHVEYSEDAESWEKLDKHIGASTGVDIYEADLKGVGARYVRLVNDKDKKVWVKFSEFSVYSYVNPGSLYLNAADGEWSMESDESTDSYAILPKENAVLKPGEYIGIKLERVHAIKEIIVEGEGTENLTVETSFNGVEWNRKDEADRARFVRLINHTNQDVSFNLDVFQVMTNEIRPMDLLESTAGTPDAPTNYWMDRDLTTKTKYCDYPKKGDSITYDLGQEIEIRSLRVYVLDTAIDYPRDAEVQVSLDNKNWKTVLTIGDGVENDGSDASTKPVESPDGKWIHDTINPAYAYKENAEIANQKARYIRLYFTAAYRHRYVELNEIQLNGGEYIPTFYDPTFETNAKLQEGFEPFKATDGDLTTAFYPDGTTEGYFIYHFQKNTDSINGINILQSGSAISNAKVSVRTGKDEWKELGTLYKSYNSVYTEDLERVYAVKIEWKDVIPMIYEIIPFSNSDGLLKKNVEEALDYLELAEADLSEEKEKLEALSAQVSEAEEAMNAAAEGSVENLQAEAAYYTLLAQMNGVEAAVAELEALQATSRAEYGRVLAKKYRQDAENAQDETEKNRLLAMAEEEESKIEGLMSSAAAKRTLAETKRNEQTTNEATAKKKQEELAAKTTVYYTVTFQYNNGSEDATVRVKENDRLEKPKSDPVKAGYDFNGWYREESLENAYNFRAKVTGSITLYAKWTKRDNDEKTQYTVTFDSRGGSSVPSQTIDEGEPAAEPAAPKKPGYTFVGWYGSEDLSEDSKYTFGTPVNSDLTLYAKWTENGGGEKAQYTVTFDSRGGSSVPSQTINEGEPATEPAAPERQGYTFLGWYSNANLSEDSKYSFETLVSADITLYAKWERDSQGGDEKAQYTATFDSRGGSAVLSQTVDEGEPITEPAAPERSGYTFAGWYSNEDLSEDSKYVFGTPMNSDITLYAKWTSNGGGEKAQYTITFDSQGGSSVPSQTVEEGAAAAEPQEPEREGYVFAGWYSNEDLSEDSKYVFGTPVNSDLTLYAKWTAIGGGEKAQYTVTFESQGGSAVSAQTVIEGERVKQPSNPTKAGAEFMGWYQDAACQVKYDFTSPVQGNLTLYAKWNVKDNTQPVKTVTSIQFKEKKYQIAKGKKINLNQEISVLPLDAANKSLTWKASNSKYAKISNGVITLLKAGAGKKIVITAEAADGSKTSASVVIQIMKHAVKKITLKAPKSVKAGKSVTVKATVKTNGKKANKKLRWTSSNTKYATVDKKGKVKTLKAGKGKRVTITAISTDGTKKKKSARILIK